MVTFRNNNNRRARFRTNDRNFKRNGDNGKYRSDFSSNNNFQRKVPGRNNHNASNLIEKYNDLAREALTNEDKILSENYFQHADHFMRVLSEKQQSSKPTETQDDSIKKNQDLSPKKVDLNPEKKVKEDSEIDKSPEKQPVKKLS